MTGRTNFGISLAGRKKYLHLSEKSTFIFKEIEERNVTVI